MERHILEQGISMVCAILHLLLRARDALPPLPLPPTIEIGGHRRRVMLQAGKQAEPGACWECSVLAPS